MGHESIAFTPMEDLDLMIRNGWGDMAQTLIPKDWRTSKNRFSPTLIFHATRASGARRSNKTDKRIGVPKRRAFRAINP